MPTTDRFSRLGRDLAGLQQLAYLRLAVGGELVPLLDQCVQPRVAGVLLGFELGLAGFLLALLEEQPRLPRRENPGGGSPGFS